MGLTSAGTLAIGVTQSNRATDKIWEAVEEAIGAGMTPEKVKREMAEAWEHFVKQQLKWDLEELRK